MLARCATVVVKVRTDEETCCGIGRTRWREDV